jgi:predicted DNA-binding transcriptional regulator AlpA
MESLLTIDEVSQILHISRRTYTAG